MTGIYSEFPLTNNSITSLAVTFLLFKKFFKLIYLFIYLFLAALALRCCARAFSSCGERGLLFVAVLRLLIAVASLAVEHGVQARGLQQLWHMGSVVVARRLQSTGSVVVAHRLSCSAARGSSRTRARTHVPCIGRRILNHCTSREVPPFVFRADSLYVFHAPLLTEQSVAF